eukprot:jgi/Mesen1/3185/ME000184S02250
MMGSHKSDQLDRFVVFLAKRDGIDKVVKTFQYVCKLAHYNFQHSHPDIAKRAKLFEGQCGLSRKAFRTGRFFTGLNTMRTTKYADWKIALLYVLGNSGEMIYFLFDHMTWMSRAGLLDAHHAAKFSFISASGEAVGYVFFITADLIQIRQGQAKERLLKQTLSRLLQEAAEASSSLSSKEPHPSTCAALSPLSSSSSLTEPPPLVGLGSSGCASIEGGAGGSLLAAGNSSSSSSSSAQEKRALEIRNVKSAIAALHMDRIMRVMSIAANVADLVIAIAEIEPNPVCCHPLTLGVSGLVSAWTGWYRAYPAKS